MTMPLVVGGIIPPEDAAALEKAGVAAVYTPKDFELNRIMSDVVRIVERANGAATSNRYLRDGARQRLRQLAGAHRLDEIEIHAGGARGGFVAVLAAAGNADHRHLARLARQRADAPRRLDAVEAGERHVHQHGVVAAARHGVDRRLAALDEIDAVAEFGEDRVHHHAAVRIVLGAQDRQRARRRRARRAARMARRASTRSTGTLRRNVGAAPGLAGDGKIAAHGLGDALDEDQAETGAAVTARDLARSPARTGGTDCLMSACVDADAAVGDGEDELARACASAGLAAAVKTTVPSWVNFTALSARFSSAARSRNASPATIAGRSSRDGDLGLDAFVAGARDQRCADRLGETARRERLVPQT